jgi:DNA/RNA endonuclease YhcR with UshA esterase domain
VSAVRVQPVAGVGALECTLVDDTGGITLVFLGRRTIAGIDIGTRMAAEGIATEHHGRLAIINPVYRLEG